MVEFVKLIITMHTLRIHVHVPACMFYLTIITNMFNTLALFKVLTGTGVQLHKLSSVRGPVASPPTSGPVHLSLAYFPLHFSSPILFIR